jgi:hypothetical protein
VRGSYLEVKRILGLECLSTTVGKIYHSRGHWAIIEGCRHCAIALTGLNYKRKKLKDNPVKISAIAET